MAPSTGAPAGVTGSIDWLFQEFRDTLDVPKEYTLTFMVRIDNDRELADDVTQRGSLGRWLLHCDIFFHAAMDMISELVIIKPDGSERPGKHPF